MFMYMRKIKNWSKFGNSPLHIAEPLVADPSPFEVDIAVAKLKSYKLPGSDQTPADLIQSIGVI
jgi:hypothetical protein